ncbi:hypothetical protein [Gymnodinialimonas ceratoperidinii]|uniref:Uncharacterized protein n=1 Tax=Gymnodinialimonas ceratoperidinii TaxID=2856823 RepID=A0A8F6TSR0_9RHOB|nr:hypothetical protein [Gymnodinialimonas ceratoperidinii]QXT38276.1 hypothetical protein KYE46_09955 [Gymnodinialimonas ceratoperidinii]
MRLSALALLLITPLAAQAQDAPVNLACDLAILCPDAGACRDWDQTITIVEGSDGWQVNWNADLPSDYELIADYLPPADSVEPVRVRTLMFRNTRAQSSQMVTFDSTGRVVVTGHQPQAGTRVVTGIGTCEPAE